jgi:hypothetical protein
VISTAFLWSDKADDEIAMQTSHNVINKSVALAKERGLWHPFVYQNYASRNQDVFAGVPLENRKRLKEIQRKYDPENIIQRLKPGYFQL